MLTTRVTGCASPSCRQDGASETAKNASPMGECVSARPKTLTFDVTEVPSYKAADSQSGTRPEESTSGCQYRVLSAPDVQCRASAHSALANALSAESQFVGSAKGTRKSPPQSNDAKSEALAWRAADERNRAAGQALELYYLLAEAEENRDLVKRSQVKIAAMLDEVKRLQGQGIRLDKGPTELQRQKIELLDREAQIQLSLDQLNGHLRQLLGFTSQDTARIWPAADLKVVVEPVDQQAAITLGLTHRSDLGLLRTLSQSLEAKSLGAARSGLSAINGMLGSSPAVSCLLGKSGLSEEIGTRNSQLSGLLAHQQRVAEEEIRQAVRTVEVRFQQIAVAKGEVNRCQQRVESLRLQRERPSSSVTTLDVGAAELQQFDAERQLIHQVIALRIAQVKLKEAQGLLVTECSSGKSS